MTSRRLLATALVCSGLALSCSGGDAEPRDPTGSGGAGSALGIAGSAGGGGSGGQGGSHGGDAGMDAAAPYDPGPVVCGAGSARFASHVISHHFGPGQNAGQQSFPAPVLGAPRGAGCCAGSLHVTSLGNGGEVVLAFANNAIVDGPGDDFVVFENPFYVGGDETQVFAELATVAASEDGKTWHEFPCKASSPPYDRCAGVSPVFANAEENEIDAFSDAAGGDRYDLAEVGLASARYVRIVDRADVTGMNGVFDLDAVGIRNSQCP